MFFFAQVKNLENVEYVEEETMATGAATTSSWALDRIDQIPSKGDKMYDPGTGRNGSGVDIYVLDTGLKRVIEFQSRLRAYMCHATTECMHAFCC